MAERLEDLNLPVTAITRIVKEVLPSNVIVSKEAKTALARAASVFILYVSNQATTIATNRNKRTISAQDVLEALSQVDFDCLIEPLKHILEDFKSTKQQKKDTKKQTPNKNSDDIDIMDTADEELEL
ncbi:DNA polymerase epsilon subunit 3 [Daktulosphaira vitifoliae]|uniref:DNA polymerase epsilon subunit 3 n=1 Tax=Daktulosphaira vitifoliae TaxID=58002 RepID=UPI0021AB0551|nr:DNA polymerase epsilon subunit 3 [Daktulosphaira vitifoliae]XP_050520436.1 DNA polymerase epsilon subunit 3 [Daktulosphaira vitifoliae]